MGNTGGARHSEQALSQGAHVGAVDTTINGVRQRDRVELSAIMSDHMALAGFSGPWTVSTQWRGGFKVDAVARGHLIRFDEPADLTGQDSAPTPHEYLLSAVAACITDGVVLHATLQGIELHELEVRVCASFDNILRWAGSSDQGSPGFHGLEITARVVSSADADLLTELWDQAIASSPVAQTIARPAELVTRLHVDPAD